MLERILREINPYVRNVNHLIGCNNKNHPIPWRQLYDYEIIFVEEGEIIVETKTEKFVVKANQTHIMRPNVLHTRYFDDNKECSYFGVHIDLFFNQFEEDFSVKDVYIKQIWDPSAKIVETSGLKKRKGYEGVKIVSVVDIAAPEKIKKSFEDLYKIFCENADEFQTISLKAKSYEIIFQILQSCRFAKVPFITQTKTYHTDIISDFISHVKTNYPEKIDLEQIAERYGISKNHFAKIFKESQNISPNNFVINFRIDEAKKLLKSGKYYIYEVASMVGYSNIHYFSRLFKLKEGVSPLEYIK